MKARTYFDALGRSAYSRGFPLKQPPFSWPQFARVAYIMGWLEQGFLKRPPNA